MKSSGTVTSTDITGSSPTTPADFAASWKARDPAISNNRPTIG